MEILQGIFLKQIHSPCFRLELPIPQQLLLTLSQTPTEAQQEDTQVPRQLQHLQQLQLQPLWDFVK